MEETLQTLIARIDEKQESMHDTLKEVLAEAKKTNGRLRAVETEVALVKEIPERVDNLEASRDKIKGAWAAVLLVGTVIGGILGYILG